MKLTKWTGPSNDSQSPITFSIEVTPDYNLADLTIYSPANYPPNEAVLWEAYDPVTCEPSGVTMSVPKAARGLGNLGLDPRPFLTTAARLGWLALTDAVIPGELYDVLIEVPTGKTAELRVEVRPAYADTVFTGVLYPEGTTAPATVTPPAPAADWWVMDGEGNIGRAATIGGALALYARVAENTELEDVSLEIQHGDYHEWVKLPADYDPGAEDGAEDADEDPAAHVYPDSPQYDVLRRMGAAFPEAEDDE